MEPTETGFQPRRDFHFFIFFYFLQTLSAASVLRGFLTLDVGTRRTLDTGVSSAACVTFGRHVLV